MPSPWIHSLVLLSCNNTHTTILIKGSVYTKEAHLFAVFIFSVLHWLFIFVHSENHSENHTNIFFTK
jgi:hypothetical protein